jgi:aminomethyltransferase
VLYEIHRELGATIVDFAGWEMPVRYRAIPDEHRKVRSAAGLFDLCHMGRLEFSGPGAEEWLQTVLTIDVARIATGRAKYGLILAESGTPIDDAILYRRRDDFLLVVNASNRARVVAWLERWRPKTPATLVDRSPSVAMIAIQGPSSPGIVSRLIERPETPWEALKYYSITRGDYIYRADRADRADRVSKPGEAGGGRGGPASEGQRVPVEVARTGYTGENGFEVFVPRELAVAFWRDALLAGGDEIWPIGLGARDTLRLEAGMPLYGHEIDETTDAFEAGLEHALQLDKPVEFVGKKALLARRAAGTQRHLRGFRLESRRVPRQGMKILLDDEEVGVVTSGTHSPTLDVPIAMGYLSAVAEAKGADRLELDVRGKREPIAITALPFVSRTRRPK